MSSLTKSSAYKYLKLWLSQLSKQFAIHGVTYVMNFFTLCNQLEQLKELTNTAYIFNCTLPVNSRVVRGIALPGNIQCHMI